MLARRGPRQQSVLTPKPKEICNVCIQRIKRVSDLLEASCGYAGRRTLQAPPQPSKPSGLTRASSEALGLLGLAVTPDSTKVHRESRGRLSKAPLGSQQQRQERQDGQQVQLVSHPSSPPPYQYHRPLNLSDLSICNTCIYLQDPSSNAAQKLQRLAKRLVLNCRLLSSDV